MGTASVELQRALAERAINGSGGATTAHLLASGDGWAVEDVVCTRGPGDRAFEEQHSTVAIAIVATGSFQYRSALGRELMTAGSLLLGNAGESFECGHDHGSGDRCIAFRYTPDYLARIASDAGVRCLGRPFQMLRLPPTQMLSSIVACARAAVAGPHESPWEEIGIRLVERTVHVASGVAHGRSAMPRGALSRVADVVRMIESEPVAKHSLGILAREARLSPYHFLRTFERLVGVTPHQYVLRMRLRDAAVRLAIERDRVVDIAFACGFGDLSNFNRAFRREFGMNPKAFRAACRARSDVLFL